MTRAPAAPSRSGSVPWGRLRAVGGAVSMAVALFALLILLPVLSGCGEISTIIETPTPEASRTSQVVTPSPLVRPSADPTAPAADLTLSLAVAPLPADPPDYDRGEWRHWVDADGDCQDARQEALIAESMVPVTFKDGELCRVASGRWTDPFTGTVLEDPGKLDVDHVVPLANAYRSGGWAWSKERKAAYANDLEYEDHLIAVTASANRSKGSRGPEEWRPPDRDYWCDYAIDWTTIKGRWELTATEAELAALREMLGSCEQTVHVEVVHRR